MTLNNAELLIKALTSCSTAQLEIYQTRFSQKKLSSVKFQTQINYFNKITKYLSTL